MGAVGTTAEDKFVNDMIKDATSSIPVNGEFDAGDLMSNGDIQSAVEAFVIQYGGNEEKILNKIQDGIEKVINTETAPMPTTQLWSNNDLDKALQYMKAHPNYTKQLLKGINPADRSAVQNVISDGQADSFAKYDSDVAEQFINQYKKMF